MPSAANEILIKSRVSIVDRMNENLSEDDEDY